MAFSVRPRAPSCSLLFLAVGLPDFAAVAMADASRQPVPELLAVELGEDTAALLFAVEVAAHVQRLDDATEFGECVGQHSRAILHLQDAHDGAGVNAAELERSCQTQQIFSVPSNEFDVNTIARKTIKHAAISGPVDAPEASVADVVRCRYWEGIARTRERARTDPHLGCLTVARNWEFNFVRNSRSREKATRYCGQFLHRPARFPMTLTSPDRSPAPLPVIELRAPVKTGPTGSPNRTIGIAGEGGQSSSVKTDGLVGFDVTFPPLSGCQPTGFAFNGGAIGTADASSFCSGVRHGTRELLPPWPAGSLPASRPSFPALICPVSASMG